VDVIPCYIGDFLNLEMSSSGDTFRDILSESFKIYSAGLPQDS